MDSHTVFQPDRAGYMAFRAEIRTEQDIKSVLEADTELRRTVQTHLDALESWWHVAREDFAQLRGKEAT